MSRSSIVGILLLLAAMVLALTAFGLGSVRRKCGASTLAPKGYDWQAIVSRFLIWLALLALAFGVVFVLRGSQACCR